MPAFALAPDAPSHEDASRAELAASYRVTIRTIRRSGNAATGRQGRTGPRVDPAKINNAPPGPTSVEDDEAAARDEVTIAEVRQTSVGRRSYPGRPRRPRRRR